MLRGSGALEVPGVTALDRGMTERVRDGIHVAGLRITLLEGTGAVVDLGQLRIAPGRM